MKDEWKRFKFNGRCRSSAGIFRLIARGVAQETVLGAVVYALEKLNNFLNDDFGMSSAGHARREEGIVR